MAARGTKQNTTGNFCRMPAKNYCKIVLVLVSVLFQANNKTFKK